MKTDEDLMIETFVFNGLVFWYITLVKEVNNAKKAISCTTINKTVSKLKTSSEGNCFMIKNYENIAIYVYCVYYESYEACGYIISLISSTSNMDMI